MFNWGLDGMYGIDPGTATFDSVSNLPREKKNFEKLYPFHSMYVRSWHIKGRTCKFCHWCVLGKCDFCQALSTLTPTSST